MNSKIALQNSNLLQLVLEQLDLGELEIQIYQLLLQHPELNVTDLAKKTGVYRLKIYNALDNLQKAELISQTADYNRKIELEPPAKIITKLKLKENNLSRINSDFEQLLPELQSQYYSSARQPITKIYQGKKEFLQIFHQILEETPKGEFILAISEGEDFYRIIDFDYFNQNWMQPRIKKGVFVNVLVRADNLDFIEMSKDNEKHLREMKVLPKDFKFPGTVWVSNNKIINWNTVMARAIVIEDKVMADFYRQMFEMLWVGVEV
jgi:sugar-specific transcriptional regulator TrmB